MYNEKKVQQGVARLLMTSGYWKDDPSLSVSEKLALMEKNTSLNHRAKYKSLHVTLNFHPDEQLSPALLKRLATEYMQRIGFGEQPFLVYQHFDAAHPHVHIIAPTIRANGTLLDLNYIGKRKSEPACRAMEQKFQLIVAEKKELTVREQIVPAHISSAMYGKGPTKKTISDIVQAVIKYYKFNSLEQLNAVLHQYHVIADQGPEHSRMHQKKGLCYSIIDTQGNKIGVPIKASSLWYQPTLTKIEALFVANHRDKKKHAPAIRQAIDQALQLTTCTNKEALATILRSHQIEVIYRTNAAGRTYGITFIDNINRVVFNGRELGKQTAAAAIEQRLAPSSNNRTEPPSPSIKPAHVERTPTNSSAAHVDPASYSEPQTAMQQLIYALLQAEYNPEYSYDPYRKRKKNKKGKEPER
ncbi:relaxase/mobilization nuclease domain-containing protein [Chitinophaga costaii]